jgi:hypothetical protein
MRLWPCPICTINPGESDAGDIKGRSQFTLEANDFARRQTNLKGGVRLFSGCRRGSRLGARHWSGEFSTDVFGEDEMFLRGTRSDAGGGLAIQAANLEYLSAAASDGEVASGVISWSANR